MIKAVGRIAGRLTGSLITVGVLLVVAAGPAGADGVVPTNYRSVIDSVSPRVGDVKVEVVGEDSFLQVTVPPGTRVEIPGYDGEPYLRIGADGRVERNRNATSTFLNRSRSGRVDLPTSTHDSSKPDWETIGNNGTAAWHDHRIHYMASGTPNVAKGELVQNWEVPIMVNGQDVKISGSLFRDGNVVPWASAVIVAAAIGAVSLIRRHGQRWAMPALVIAAAAALAVSASFAWLNPPGSEASWLPVILPVAAIFAGLSTRLIPADRPAVLRLAPLLAAVACLLGWVVPIFGVLWMPNIPSLLAPAIVRVAVALVVGVTVGSAASLLIWPDAALNANPGEPKTPPSTA